MHIQPLNVNNLFFQKINIKPINIKIKKNCHLMRELKVALTVYIDKRIKKGLYN